MSQIMFPSLSEDGWVTSSQRIADKMLAHFFVSDYSQTIMFPGLITSFPYILAINHGNIPAICSETRGALENYFSNYFQKVAVSVEDVTDQNNPSRAALSIAIDFVDDTGQQYSVGQAIQVVDSVFKKVANIINS